MKLRDALGEILGPKVYATWPLSVEWAVSVALGLAESSPKGTEAESKLIAWWDREVAAGRFPYARTQKTRSTAALAEALARDFNREVSPEFLGKLRRAMGASS